MEKALILNNADFEKFSEIRHAIVAMGATIALHRRGSMTTEEALNRIVAEIKKADDAIGILSIGGL
jgi:hypothetical protein